MTNPIVMMLPSLYRGDSIPASVLSVTDPKHRGRTFAEYFITDGLVAKAADHGWSKDFNRPLVDLVLTHVGYDDSDEQRRQAYHSPLISFSSSLDKATQFMNRNKKQTEACKLEEAEFFVWLLEGVFATRIGVGIYSFDFFSSTRTVKHLMAPVPSNLNSMDEVAKALMQHIVHKNIDEDFSSHKATIINSIEYIQSIDPNSVDNSLYSRALERAKKWSEWLIYPNDPMENGQHGLSDKFPLNSCLHAYAFFRKR